MFPRGWRWLMCAAVAVVLGAAATSASAAALTLQATRSETGWIRLAVANADPAGSLVVTEQIGDRSLPIAQATPVDGQVELPRAALWRCDRLHRTFVATASYADGSTQTATAAIATPSCKKRLVLSVRKTRGGFEMRAADRWRVGDVSVRGCVRKPGQRAACRALKIAPGGKDARRAYRSRADGLWRASLTSAWGQRTARVLYVRPRGKLRLLATGDSMIQIVDGHLKQRLEKRGFAVRSDARISTGLSKPFLLNWPRLATSQAKRIRPDVTVVFIGANDGFSFGDIECCGDRWVDAYAKRVRTMMSAYSRAGRGLVYWLTLPAPRPAEWRSVYPAVNRAIKRAAARFGGDIHVIDSAKIFTPGGRFRQTMTWRGHRVSVRQPDGVHLSPAGASIAEALIERALRSDGAL